jgi:molecular chaperone GrpE
MTDDTNKPEAETVILDELQAGVATEANGEEDTQPDALELLKAENDDLRDRFIRLAADMDNLRRRTEREIKDAKVYAVSNFARDMLAVSDNLRRALDVVAAEAAKGADSGNAGFVEGVEMTERSMLSALERHGIRKIEAEGAKFDPNFHQAMFEVPNPAVPNNTVVQVVQAGFTIGDRVLRPAMVGVAKGGPKPEAAASSEPGTDGLNEKDA